MLTEFNIGVQNIDSLIWVKHHILRPDLRKWSHRKCLCWELVRLRLAGSDNDTIRYSAVSAGPGTTARLGSMIYTRRIFLPVRLDFLLEPSEGSRGGSVLEVLLQSGDLPFARGCSFLVQFHLNQQHRTVPNTIRQEIAGNQKAGLRMAYRDEDNGWSFATIHSGTPLQIKSPPTAQGAPVAVG